MSRGLEVVGARQLRASLKRAGLDVADLKEAHAQVAALVRTAATPATPRVSGELEATVRSSGTARAAIVRAGNARHPYAGPVHWGWPARNIVAQPWIDTAAETILETGGAALYLHALETIIHRIEGAPGR